MTEQRRIMETRPGGNWATKSLCISYMEKGFMSRFLSPVNVYVQGSVLTPYGLILFTHAADWTKCFRGWLSLADQ